MADEQRAISGAALLIRCQSQEVGFAENLNGTETISNQRVKAFGDIRGKEFVPADYMVEFRVAYFRIKELPLNRQKAWPRVDGQETTIRILQFPELTFEIVDQTDERVIERILRCRPKQRNFRCDAAGIFGEDAAWDAIETAPGDATVT